MADSREAQANGMERGVHVEALGECTDVEALRRIIEPRGRHLFDVGCGDGWLARELVAAGATVSAFEPDPEQARRNAAAAVTPGVTFFAAPAESLPAAEQSADGVLFNYSLHHVPRAHQHTALREARRVLRTDGFLYVAEPLPQGSFSHVMQPVHDETLVQQSAERALAAHARPHFAAERVFSYVTVSRYEDFEAFVDEMMAPTYVSYSREQLQGKPVRSRFEACREEGGYVLRQPIRVNLYLGVRPARSERFVR